MLSGQHTHRSYHERTFHRLKQNDRRPSYHESTMVANRNLVNFSYPAAIIVNLSYQFPTSCMLFGQHTSMKYYMKLCYYRESYSYLCMQQFDYNARNVSRFDGLLITAQVLAHMQKIHTWNTGGHCLNLVRPKTLTTSGCHLTNNFPYTGIVIFSSIRNHEVLT